jgi:putative MATE family efflux protein
MSIIQAFGMAIGVGAASYISRLLGAKRDEEASRTLSTAFFTSIGVGAVMMILGFVFMRPLVKIMGATPDIIDYSIDYASFILYGAPFVAGSFVLNQCLRAEGSATFSMIGMGIGAVINLILDPIFIFTLGWEVAGASAATAISQVISFIILLYPFFRKHSLLHLSPKLITYTKSIISEISKMGFPTLLRTGLMTVSSVVTNNVAGGFSTEALAAISVVNRFMMFIGSALIGFGQGFQPVAGYNWGAKRYDRVWKSFTFSSIVGIAGMVLFCSVVAIVAPWIMRAFSDESSVIDIGAFSIRLQCLAMPIHAWVIVVNMLFQAMGRGTSAAVLSFARQGICFIPAVIVLSLAFGVWGLAAAQAASGVLIRVMKEIKKLMAENQQITQ